MGEAISFSWVTGLVLLILPYLHLIGIYIRLGRLGGRNTGRYCPYCISPINSQARACPHCTRDLPDGPRTS